MTSALLAIAILSATQPPGPQAAAGNLLPWFARPTPCRLCAPQDSPVPQKKPSSEGRGLDTALGGATGLLMGWKGSGLLAEPQRSPGAVFRGSKPAIVWGAAAALFVARKLTQDENEDEPLGITIPSKQPRSPFAIDAAVRGWTGGRLSPGARHFVDRASYWTLGHLMAQPFGLLASGSQRVDRAQDLLIPLEAFAVTTLITDQVKHLVHRTRPYARNDGSTDESELRDHSRRLSFFSGHTAGAFALAASTSRVMSVRQWKNARTLRRTNYALATATGLFRVLADRHYLTDVLAGAAVGWTTGYLVAKWRANAARTGLPEPVAEVAPMVSITLPAGRNGVMTAQFGHGFGLTFRLVR